MGLWGKRDDMVVHGREPFNAEPPGTALARTAITPADTFYARNHGPVPRLDPADWRLTVDGLVTRPLLLTLAGLRSGFDATEATVTLQCAGNRRTDLTVVRAVPGETPWGPGALSTARFRGYASPTSSPGPVSPRGRPHRLPRPRRLPVRRPAPAVRGVHPP